DVGTKFPPETEKIPKVGHPYRPSIEGMISLQPELVIASEENLPEATVQQLRSAKIPVLIIENSGKRIEDLEKRIQTIATATGVPDEGSKLTTEMKKKFEETKNKADALRKKHGLKRVFFLYAHGPGKAFIYGTETGSHVLIELVGAKNAADFTSGVKPLTAEAMVQAAPDAIIMLERGLTSVEGLEGALKLPGVALTPAGKNRLIIQVDDSIRWISPRFPDFASKLLAELYKEKP
ncbi:MAG: ABC transporter substrate-binding protein, partial [Bdellovibrionales bacterium]|nr:ABC transporter substrate-binding protein [Bdellovibrionales bacterium]